MIDTDPIELAQRRLALALDALEVATERRREAAREEAALADQVHALGSDRARLASELDDATARARALETAGRELAERIEGAIATIRNVLEFDEQDAAEKTSNGDAA